MCAAISSKSGATLPKTESEPQITWIAALYDHFDLIGKSLYIGRRTDDIREGYRSTIAQKYLIFYRVAEKDVEIKRVIHGRRDLESALDE